MKYVLLGSALYHTEEIPLREVGVYGIFNTMDEAKEAALSEAHVYAGDMRTSEDEFEVRELEWEDFGSQGDSFAISHGIEFVYRVAKVD